MRKISGASSALALAFVLMGCTSVESVLFTTKTSLGLDFDSQPATANIAYDRVEGYFAPRYRNGALPAVLASIDSDGAIFNPKIRQVYATGTAAKILAAKDSAGVKDGPTELERLPEKGDERKLVFFGTTTTVGLKVGFVGNAPESFTFGYKRKEFSLIPLATKIEKDKRVDVYPSVLASLDSSADVGSDPKAPRARLDNGQFFATGRAAERLARNNDVGLGEYFRKRSVDPIRNFIKVEAEQEDQLATILACYAAISSEDRRAVWEHADTLGLLANDRKQKLEKLIRESNGATAPDDRERLLRYANIQYAADIRSTHGDNRARTAMLKAHKGFVCGRARVGLVREQANGTQP